jgi:hypothetical protein
MLEGPRPTPVVCTQKRRSDRPISNLMGDGSFEERRTISVHSAIHMSLRLNSRSCFPLSLGVSSVTVSLSRAALFTLSDFGKNLTANCLNP